MKTRQEMWMCADELGIQEAALRLPSSSKKLGTQITKRIYTDIMLANIFSIYNLLLLNILQVINRKYGRNF